MCAANSTTVSVFFCSGEKTKKKRAYHTQEQRAQQNRLLQSAGHSKTLKTLVFNVVIPVLANLFLQKKKNIDIIHIKNIYIVAATE